MSSLRWLCLAALLVACGDDGEVGHTTVGSGDAGSTGSATSSASTTDVDAESGTASQTGPVDSSGASTSADEGGTTEAPFIVCADLVCGPGEICITPCCGGPAPGCGPARGPQCPPGTHPVDACRFGQPCDGGLCCEDDPCVAAFPYCIAMEDVMCTDDPNSPDVHCSIADCSGRLVEGIVACECA